MANFNALNTKLKSFKLSSGFENLLSETTTIASSVQALNSTSLGSILNETVSGIQALNTTVNAATSIATLTGNIPGIQDQIIKDVSQSKTALDAICGTANDNGFLDIVITCPTPEGVKAATKSIATVTDKQTEAILANTTPKQYAGQIKDIAAKDYTALSSDFSSQVGSYLSAFSSINVKQTGNPLQDIVLQTDSTPLNMLENFGVPKDQTADILVLLQDNNIIDASIQVANVTGKPITEVEVFLTTIPANLIDQLATAGTEVSSTGTYDVTGKANTWQGAKTPPEYFDVIATQEQLIIEFIKCGREITEVVFYGHEMSPNQVLSARDIHQSYNADGNDGIPFHYVVQPSGNLQRGRDIAIEGTYSTTHDKYSIGIVIPYYTNGSANIHQGATINSVLKAFYQVWPGGQVFDAQLDLNESEISVGVSIDNYIDSFKKTNHGGSSRSFSTSQLISAAQGGI